MYGFHSELLLRCIPKQESEFRFEVYKPFTYSSMYGYKITVPAGFKTDFASVPWFFRRIIPATGRYNEATVLHDYLCYLSNKKEFDRSLADVLFMEAMEFLGVSKLKRSLMYSGVRLYSELLFVKNKILGK